MQHMLSHAASICFGTTFFLRKIFAGLTATAVFGVEPEAAWQDGLYHSMSVNIMVRLIIVLACCRAGSDDRT